MTIKIDTMSNICKQYIKNEKNIHFCKIDVEGEEKNVLLGFNFENCRPNVFVIESTKPGTMIPSFSEWENILDKYIEIKKTNLELDIFKLFFHFYH